MSLILDALKRAERERRAGQAPMPLDSIQLPQPDAPGPGARRWLLPALIGAVVAGGAVYLLLALRHPSATAPEAVIAAAPALPLPVSAAPVQTAAPPAAETPAAPAEAPAIQSDAKIATLDDLVDDRARPPAGDSARSPARDALPPEPAESRSVPPPPPTAAAAPPTLDELPPSMQPESGAAAEPLRPPPVPAPAPQPAQVQAPTTDASAAEPAVAGGSATDGARNFREMSPSYRAEFPALSVDVHVYNDDPQRRFVILNGKRYREGDTLAEGPKLVGIVANGVVFDWRGERVLYSLPH
jgi:general secretion pathway protein B